MNHKPWLLIGLGILISIFTLSIFIPPAVIASDGSGPAPANRQPTILDALDFTALDGGDAFTCALTSSGGVKCWGDNRSGQLGDGTIQSRNVPVNVFGLNSGVTALAVGGMHACTIVSGGVECWGENQWGQLGNGTTTDSSVPVPVVGLASGVIALAAGDQQNCAILVGGGVKCWGMNQYGVLGDGTTDYRLSPVDVEGLSAGVTAVTTGKLHSCALMAGGSVKCWGVYGYVANDNDWYDTLYTTTPVDKTGLDSGVTAISAGDDHVCALSPQGGVSCWGHFSVGQLGDGQEGSSPMFIYYTDIPVNVIGLESGVLSLEAGSMHTCALTQSGAIYCWGYNDYGQLGDGTMATRTTPVAVTGLSGVPARIAAGGYHSCALLSGGAARCWGANNLNQLGNGATYDRNMPVDVTGLPTGSTAIAAGSTNTCALTGSGGVRCWGFNWYGQVGDGTTIDRNAPVDVVGLAAGGTAITVGEYIACAVLSGESVWCWGSNSHYQLGENGGEGSSIPVEVTGLTGGINAIEAAFLHTCVLTAVGGVKCWGDNYVGELGTGGTNDSSYVPVNVIGLTSEVTALSVGYRHSCAITSTGGIQCWGINASGQLGDGSTTDHNAPVDVVGLAGEAIAVSAGVNHTCAVITGGGVQCWGSNAHGALGDGTTTDHPSPIDVTGLPGEAIAVTAAADHSCVLLQDGEAVCWGANTHGQLGDGTLQDQLTPVGVVGLAHNVQAISAGTQFTCALAGEGRMKCWGADDDGELGIGASQKVLTPVDVVEQAPPFATLNYQRGQPGSFLTLTGWGFPPESQAGLIINGQALTTTITVNPTGGFTVFLDTSQAATGGYAVAVDTTSGGGLALGQATGVPASFFLADNLPVRLQEGGGQTYVVPANSALHQFVYCPVVNK